MASFSVAFAWLMSSEDSQCSYKAVPDAPAGSFAISGINSHSFPVQFNRIALIPQAQRGPAVQEFYEGMFWNVWFDRLDSDEVAKRVFDCSVNEGPGAAVKLLQKALQKTDGVQGQIDGVMGWETVRRANACDPDALVASFKATREDAYRNIVAAKPEDAEYLNGWLARAGR
jgi:type VI secretion system secreted protein VgrG